MKVFVIGSGGREHALCWKLAQSPGAKLFAAPGNPGIASIATTLVTTDYLAAADKFRPDLTIIGPEAPLVAGIADQLRAKGFDVVGPSAAAAQIESSKRFAKAVMDAAAIPTARYIAVDSMADARKALRSFPLPVVLKADGLAAGKGVVIAHSAEDVEHALPSLFMISGRLVIEEFLVGEEVSFMVLTDGNRVLPLEPTQDHKTIFDGDQGPNTGGMGAYCDSRILDNALRQQVLSTVIEPALHQMRAQGHPFSGFLYAGLMLTPAGLKVLEFNARLGDPETQAILQRMDGDLLPVLMDAARQQLRQDSLLFQPDPSVCVVLAAAGYPANVRTGDPISGVEHVREATLFHAGTKLHENVLMTSGGRVLGVTASGPTLPAAMDTAYREIRHIHFDGMQYRKDIGKKGLKRW